MDPDAIQAVYDRAYAEGILQARVVYDPDSGVVDARIENGELIQTKVPRRRGQFMDTLGYDDNPDPVLDV